MANTQSRSSGLFTGLVFISVGLLLLVRNYGHIDLGRLFWHWWPLLIIFWGAVKLYERHRRASIRREWRGNHRRGSIIGIWDARFIKRSCSV